MVRPTLIMDALLAKNRFAILGKVSQETHFRQPLPVTDNKDQLPLSSQGTGAIGKTYKSWELTDISDSQCDRLAGQTVLVEIIASEVSNRI